MNIKKVKIVTMIPRDCVDKVRNSICSIGAGIIGNYSYCTTSTKCTGTFKPNSKANPYIGEKDKIEFVEEEKLEIICDKSKVKEVILKIKETHPYEEPEIDIIPLLEESDFI